jgi:hypothetical protein
MREYIFPGKIAYQRVNANGNETISFVLHRLLCLKGELAVGY